MLTLEQKLNLMKVKLSRVFTQTDSCGKDTASLTLSVAYDSDKSIVDRILSLYVFDHKYGTTTDITNIMADHFGTQLNEMVASVNWEEIYQQNKFCFEGQDKFAAMQDQVQSCVVEGY